MFFLQRTVVAQQVQFVGTNPQGQQIIVLSSAQTTAHQQGMLLPVQLGMRRYHLKLTSENEK